jgi:glycosyltransferase involved in cell wall biosynthesis
VPRLRYVSRTRGRHDQRWVDTLRSAGHEVDTTDLADVGRPGEVDLIVAGPLTDAVPAAVDAGLAPVLALAWAFDVLVEAQDPELRRRMEHGLRGSVGVHVDCEAMRRAVIDHGADPARVSLAPWGIDTGYFDLRPPDADLRAGYGFEPGDVILLSTRAWEPSYDVDVVVDAFARARSERPDLRLVLAGGGSRARQVRARIAELGLEGSCATPGVIDQAGVRDLLRIADIYVSASRSDGTSLSLLEALACGVPAVVPAIGGNPEWVNGPALGELFDVGSADGLAEAVLAVADRLPSGPQGRRARRDVVLASGRWERNRAVFLRAVDRALERPG